MDLKDTYKTIAFATEPILYKEKNSKFYGYAFPIVSENEIKKLTESLRKKHFGAGHFCFAFQIGTEKLIYRTNDDGEPNNTAGQPIYGQIQSYGLTNILVVVVRFFGGTKLGVGGLINAYKNAAQMTLESSLIIEKTIDVHFLISFDYKNMNKVMRIIKEKKLKIAAHKMENDCEIEIISRKKNANTIFEIFNALFEIGIQIIE
ncbi:MAG: YigZ family protein [Flavobacterium sp.]|nr:YigZ family protein [Flavobacterium sp.]